jgi:GntR family transcriptional regulator, galactonate operon transcriptional repressor
MAPRQAARRTFQEQVLDQLGQDICSGRFKPGQVIPSETELCRRFAFSRIVIREAVKSLAAKGMVEVRRKMGTIVLEPAHWNLFDRDIVAWRANSAGVNRILARDLMELRAIVEPAAARLSAIRATDEDRRALRAAYSAMERAVAGKGDYVSADLAFHAVVLSACNNQLIQQMQNAFSAILRTMFEIVSVKPGGPAHSLPMHKAVCAAIEAGDANRAEIAASALIRQAQRDLEECLESDGIPRGKPARRRS